jgi:hypothetical protein
MLREMPRFAGAVVLAAVVLAAAGCGGVHAQGEPRGPAPTTTVHVLTGRQLPQRLLTVIAGMTRPHRGADRSFVRKVEVYGPGSRAALVRASSGEWVSETARERKSRFYLVVLYGRFLCGSCSRPAGAKPPFGTIETSIWSPTVGGTDFGLSKRLPAAVSRLKRLAVISVPEPRA